MDVARCDIAQYDVKDDKNLYSQSQLITMATMWQAIGAGSKGKYQAACEVC
jgi:hypothetical protein